MSLKYLNLTGLSRVITNLKNWVTSQIPTKTSEITNDSGFITNTSDCVHTTGTESIGGAKTFTTSPLTLSGNIGLYWNRGGTVGTNPSSTMYYAATRVRDSSSNTYFLSRGSIDTTGYNQYQLIVYDWSDTSKYTRLRICQANGEEGYLISNASVFRGETADTLQLGTASYPMKSVRANAYYLGSTAFGDIVTHSASEFLTSHQSLSNYVTLDGAQTISATKTFTKNQSLKTTAITSNTTAPSADTTGNGFTFYDNLGKYWGAIQPKWLADGSFSINFYMSNWTTAGTQGFWYLQWGTDKAFSSVYFRPYNNNTVNLGDSSHKWNSVYATTFYGALTGNVTGNCSGSSGSCTGNAATATTAGNVTGTVAIANGGTGATTRLNAVKALTSENVGTDTNYFLTITTNWGKAGYCSVANAKTVLGLESGAFTTAYVHPTTAGNKHIPSGGSTGQILRYSASGTAAWANRGVFVSIANRTSTGTWTVTVTNHCIYFLTGTMNQASGGGSISITSGGTILGGYTTPIGNASSCLPGGSIIYSYAGASTGTTIYFRVLIFSTATSMKFTITSELFSDVNLNLCV